MSHIEQPNVDRELAKLKAFQRDTVEHVFRRMYDDEAPVRRFLVADEVGLGKTLVARGLVAKIIDRLWNQVERIDIVYICSNGSIARQNIGRLNVSEARDATLPSRITLLPKVVHGLKSRKLNFISLTPQTSFDLRSSLGTYEERALLYWLLPDDWRPSATAARNLLQGTADRDRFRERVDEFDHDSVDAELRDAFRQYLAGERGLRDEFLQAAEHFQVWRERPPDEARNAQRGVIGKLRSGLATSCLRALEPDLVILDEFQRFKHLLDGIDPAGELARDLFSFGDARVLLLSATPYKPYTTAEEAETDDHYRDFIQTVRFLHADPAKTAAFQSSLARYRDAVLDVTQANGDLLAAKDRVETGLREIMVRTERLAASADRNGMLTEIVLSPPLAIDEVSAYLSYARVAQALGHADITEYWKSAPYLLNFMDEYEFKRDFTEGLQKASSSSTLLGALTSEPASLLPWDDVERYRPLDPANARLRQLIADTVGIGAWRWLWLPPSLPYYRMRGAYHQADVRQVTKRLIFSSWQVVPKVLAAVLSYEAERRMFEGSYDVERPNTPAERDRLTQRLRGMPLLTLSYPSLTLAELGDPLTVARQGADRSLRDVSEVLSVVRERVRAALRGVIPDDSQGPPDPAWYWAAPLLLDLKHHADATGRWLAQSDLAAVWRSSVEQGAADEPTAADDWAEDVAQFLRVARGQVRLGAPPADLVDVVAKVSLGGPGIVALRALCRVLGDEFRGHVSIRNNAGWIATGFRTLFNLPEVTAMLRGKGPTGSEDRYWEQVLDYCIDGGIQSVMDEYVHVAEEWLGVAYKPAQVAAKDIAANIASAMQLRTAQVGVDVPSAVDGQTSMADHRMRARFAARFGARQTDEGAAAMRADDVRLAFNSPFWPFVLCSTSVGQEGLDFHLYCHAVMHWNLPSNPVDLEQREGRVHRYKGHAIRKNVALLHAVDGVFSNAADPWSRMFETAHAQAPAETSDLVPFWILPVEGGASIQRHLPVLPLSRDVDRAAALRKALTVYRMAFGQNRQDDVVAYLTALVPPDQIKELGERLRINLSPQHAEESRSRPAMWRRDVEDSIEASVAESASLRPALSLDGARSLLSEYAALKARTACLDVEQYRDLLDRYAALRG
jgi:hypothetical protein